MIPNPMKPASENITLKDLQELQYPIIATAKIDGIGCRIYEDSPYSPQNKQLPNLLVHGWVEAHRVLHGLQGELVDRDFNTTTSVVMSGLGDIKNLEFVVYDNFLDKRGYLERLIAVTAVAKHFKSDKIPLRVVPYLICYTPDEVKDYYRRMLGRGYEGLVLRDPSGEYKQGRCTLKEGLALKMKPFADAEAIVVGFLPLQKNTNHAKTNELGRSSRSKHAAGLQELQMLGAFMVRDDRGRTFKIGGGNLSAAMRKEMWTNRASYMGRTITYQFLAHGEKDLPRSPKFLRFR
jgi:DNA ligase-1